MFPKCWHCQDWFFDLCQFAALWEKFHGGVEVFVASTVLKHVKDDVGDGEGGNGEDEAGQDHPSLHLPPSTEFLKIHLTRCVKVRKGV